MCYSAVRAVLFLYVYVCFFHCYGDHRDLHSFPTRRSSDLITRLAGELGKLETQAKSTGSAFSKFGADIVTLKDRKSTRLNSSHQIISYAVFCLKKKNNNFRYPNAC